MDCINCGHPETHHDAGECWTDDQGREVFTYAEQACRCSWADFSEDGAEFIAKTLELAGVDRPSHLAGLIVGMLKAAGYRIDPPRRRRLIVTEEL